MTLPRVSICLPIYNGERHVRETIGSVLGQTFDDFELVISDNASTDSTPRICEGIALADSRVKYTRAARNRGLAWNFNQAFALARGHYVLWIGHDDLLAPDYVRTCVDALDRDPQAALCFANVNYIDLHGNLIQRVELSNPGASDSRAERFASILDDPRCDPVCGLIRRDFLLRTGLHRGYADSDRVLLAELGFQGRFLHLPDFLFSRRVHQQQATTQFPDRWDRTLVFDPAKAGTAINPWWSEALDLLGTIRRARLPRDERLRCYKFLYWWCNVHRHFFAQDLHRSAQLLFRRALRRPLPIDHRYASATTAREKEPGVRVVRAMGFEHVVEDTPRHDQEPHAGRGMVSVVIPCFNSAHFVGAAIQSALAQTYRPLEVVVVNDGSTDHFDDAVAPFADQIRIIRQANAGLAASRNRGIEEGNGEFVAFLDADDLWSLDKIAKQVAVLQARPDCAVVHTRPRYVGPDGEPIEFCVASWYAHPADGQCTLSLIAHNTVIVSSVLLRRAALATEPPFAAGMMGCEDWNLWLRLSVRFGFAFIDEPLTCYRRHGNNMSSKALSMQRSTIAAVKNFLRYPLSPSARRAARRQLRESTLVMAHLEYDSANMPSARWHFVRAGHAIRLRDMPRFILAWLPLRMSAWLRRIFKPRDQTMGAPTIDTSRSTGTQT